jgi:hypothetical protein
LTLGFVCIRKHKRRFWIQQTIWDCPRMWFVILSEDQHKTSGYFMAGLWSLCLSCGLLFITLADTIII